MTTTKIIRFYVATLSGVTVLSFVIYNLVGLALTTY